MQFFGGRRGQPGEGHRVAVREHLQEITLRTADPGADRGKRIRVVQLGYGRGAKLIIDAGGDQEVFRFLDLRHQRAHAVQPAGLGIAVRAVLDVHGHVVDEPCVHDLFQRLRERAVRIQFDGIAQRLDLRQQLRQFFAHQRFPAGERHAFQDALAAFEELQQRRVVHDAGRVSIQQLAVVAERAAEIAARKKDRAGHAARIVQQRHLL